MDFGSKKFNFKANKTVVIAEVGVNHNQSLEIAKKMADIAKKCGADIVKYQLFHSSDEISSIAEKANYQKKNTSDQEGVNQLEMCQKLELSEQDIREIKNYCDKIKMPFLCTAFESRSLNFLTKNLKVKSVKIPSSEITNLPFLREIGSKKIGVILSSGASNIWEIGLAIKTLQDAGCPELVLFHCVSDYPAPFSELNLRSMQTLEKTFNIPVGFSDHSLGIVAPMIAASLGAVAIEKHFTLDENMVGPDHKASIEPKELTEICKGVKIAHMVLGSTFKKPSKSEMKNKDLIRKSLVANFDLKKGQILDQNHIGIKRPRGGIEPSFYDIVIGRKILKDIKKDEFITWSDI